MTNRWKRLTALMLILLTLLNAGSALAAEEFWKWGDEFQQWEAWEGQVGVLSTQVYKDELYFVYGRLLLKCHDPESKPEEVMQLKKLLPEEEQPYYAEDNYYGHIVLTAYLFTDGDALYIFAQGMHKVFRIDFVDGEKIYMRGIYGTSQNTKAGFFCFSLENGKGKLLGNVLATTQIVSWQENPEWASTLLIMRNDGHWEWKGDTSYYLDERAVLVYNPETFEPEQTVFAFANLGLENQKEYDLDLGVYHYNPSCTALAVDAESGRFFFLHDDIAWYTDGTTTARGFDRLPEEAYHAAYGFFWKGNYYYMTHGDTLYVCDMSRVP